MKLLLALVTAALLLEAGRRRVEKLNGACAAAEEIIRFVMLVKHGISYRAASFSDLMHEGEQSGFRFLRFTDAGVETHGCVDAKTAADLKAFVAGIGTTDREAQDSLCDEYLSLFRFQREQALSLLVSKTRVSRAVSAFSALCVLILLL